MRKLIPFFILFGAFTTNAQTKDVQLSWTDANYGVGSENYFIPTFQNEYLKFDAVTKSITANVSINNVTGNSLKVISYKTEPIDASKYKAINFKNVSSVIDAKVRFFQNNDNRVGFVSFNPIIKKGTSYEKVTHVVFEIVNDAKSKFASKNLTETQSVLASGNWFKFKINESGAYKIDKKFLSDIGLPSNVDPRTIKIYGHGGSMLPLDNEANQFFDLPEVALRFVGEEDGVLNDADYLLFYGIGTKGWNAENATHLNLYSNDAYYYITYGNGVGKRMVGYSQPSGNSTENYTDYLERAFYEEDLYNLNQMNRKWFGKNFNSSATGKLDFPLQTPMLNSNKPVKFSSNVAAESSNTVYFSFSINNQNIGSKNLLTSTNSKAIYEGYYQTDVPLTTENNTVSVNFQNNGIPSAKGFIDFIAIDYYKHLAGNNKQFIFSFPNTLTNVGVASFQINNAQNISQVWDIVDPYNATFYGNSSNTITVKFPMGSENKFLAVDTNDLKQPISLPNAKVSNQDLKGTILKDGKVDYVIITNNTLLSAAQRLANLHKIHQNLNVKVVPVEVIYNEFSSGQQDIVAIRNFIKYVYEAGNKTLKYVNFFGDASTDYLNRISNNTNQVPIYHTLYNQLANESSINFSESSTLATDDFFALLDDGEKIIQNSEYSGLDVAVGRIPVNTLQQANVVVNKIEQYLSKENVGRWKNNYTALADDVDGFSDDTLQNTLNTMVDDLVSNKPYFNVKKVIADSYQQQVVAGGPRYPKAKEDFLQGINSGSLMVSYLGHGSETQLGEEHYFDVNDIDELKNQDKYPLFSIMTCDFTRFDNPELLSGGERLFLRDKAGAIGIFATTRKIAISNANRFTSNVSKWLFDYQNNLPDVTMAEALMHTKNDNSSFVGDKGMVAFIGDPALKLSIPKPNVVITHVNDAQIQDFTGSLRALDKVKLKGQVTSENGQLISNFNGNLAVQLFDKNVDKTTLVNDNIGSPMNFTTLGETFFRGNASVSNGNFEIEFVVPKDIKIAVGDGKASFYAAKESNILDDYTGANTTLKVGGVNENAAEDNKAPELKLFMNDESFISGGTTNNSPLFLVHLSDENGMNTASGIGHDMVAILDGDENNPIVMNEFYETEPNNFTKGFINYPFSNLKEGLHTITFKAWDVYNNLAISTLDFVVTASSGLQLDKVLNYPNPFVDYTEFWFQHNRPNETLQVQVQILTVTGKVVKTINQTVVSDNILSRDIKWDGRDDFGEKIGKGVYIYKLKVKATESNQEAEKIEKLVIL